MLNAETIFIANKMQPNQYTFVLIEKFAMKFITLCAKKEIKEKLFNVEILKNRRIKTI